MNMDKSIKKPRKVSKKLCKIKSADNSKKIKKEHHDSMKKSKSSRKRKLSTGDSGVPKKSAKEKSVLSPKNAEQNVNLEEKSKDNFLELISEKQNEVLQERGSNIAGCSFGSPIDTSFPENIFEEPSPIIDAVFDIIHNTDNDNKENDQKNTVSTISSVSNNAELKESNTKNDSKNGKVKLKKKKKKSSHETNSSKEIGKLIQENEYLKSRLRQREDELNAIRQLNIDIQNKILNKIDEYATRQINPFSTMGLSDVSLGHINQETRKIHCGNGFYMCYDRYLDAVNRASSVNSTTKLSSKKNGSETVTNKRYTSFVKSVAVTIVGLETLKNSSVKGRKCNRIEGSTAKPAIAPEKLKAIYGIFEYYLRSEIKLDPVLFLLTLPVKSRI